MITLLSTVIGFLCPALPKVFEFFQDKQDKKHEIKLLEMQMQVQQQERSGRLNEIGIETDIRESEALYNASKPVLSGVQWIDATIALLTSSVRPVITYAFFCFYSSVKISMLIQAENVLQIWTKEDMALFCTILAFWFGNRAMQKFFERK